ncbi:lipoprotein [Streptomyces sp. NRRL F-5755]|uniref:L,D-transpeptidase family protein n=1 Tax=Streptomyces sp. NRRL F-5755 TaxID=1519475 RepID=UPI0006AE83E8|nr:L,D-transpeptidase family protein [Streptomyces sp. NRRL F-5755]KOT86882.1 lipoprotein [Streptomyces sp. NRRL F-5755]
MGIMRTAGCMVRKAAVAAVGLALLAGCGTGGGTADDEGKGNDRRKAEAAAYSKDLPGVGAQLRARIPAETRQVVAVYGKGADSPDATLVLYTKTAKGWHRTADWPAHNGRKGWTTDHHEDDLRSPVGVYSLTDAGGVLPDPGAKLPYTHSAAFTPPPYWEKKTRHDFDHVIAVDYNRVKGTSPLDPTRPQGQKKGGGIWLHLDHGSGTSGCVSISKAGLVTLLRTLDPRQRPVVVMGDRAHLAA